MRGLAEREMTADQIAEGQRLSAAFVPTCSWQMEGAGDGERLPESGREGSAGTALGNLAGTGTGIFVTADGWLVTNAHVAGAGSRVMIKQGEQLLPAVLKQTDAANDLALLKVEGEFNALPIESSRSAALGASVFTIGFPNPSLQGFSPKMTKGEISSLAGAQDDPRYFQVSIPIQPGNSGGALVDASGNVVGVVTAKIDDLAAIQTSGAIPQNVNYAIKSTYLLALVESMPDAAKGLKEPTKTTDFTAAVQAVEKASAMVLVFR